MDVRQIRERVAYQAGTCENWREAKVPHDLFARSPDTLLDHGFAVGTPRTAYLSGTQKRTEGALSDTEVAVRWAMAIRPKDQTDSYGEALDAERKLTAAVMGLDRADLTSFRFISAARAVQGDWFIGDLSFVCRHRLALE